MRDRVCVVTGATGGIGFETARGIAREHATLVIVGRDRARCAAAVERIRQDTGNRNVQFLRADLSLQGDVRQLAAALQADYPRLHVLVNNVGGMYLNGQVSGDGIEMTVAVNHLGPYLLTRLLCPVLEASAPARIVNVSSVAHLGARMDPPPYSWGGWKGYKRSKLANLLFTYELARRLDGRGVTVNALSPGLVASNFGKNNSGLFPWVKPLIDRFAVDSAEGARTSVYLACSPEVAHVTGTYFTRGKPRRSSAASRDHDAATELWRVSAEMTGLPAD